MLLCEVLFCLPSRCVLLLSSFWSFLFLVFSVPLFSTLAVILVPDVVVWTVVSLTVVFVTVSFSARSLSVVRSRVRINTVTTSIITVVIVLGSGSVVIVNRVVIGVRAVRHIECTQHRR